MRHVITGGLGFTGKYLAEELVRRGEDVVVFDAAEPSSSLPKDVRFVAGDIRDAAAVARIGLKEGDIVHHLAARQFHGSVPYANRDGWFRDVNVEGTKVLL